MRTPPSFDGRDFAQLSAEMADAFARDGLLVLEKLIPAADCRALMARMDAIIAALDPATLPRSVFASGSDPQAEDEYFLLSGRDIRFFFERGAFDEMGVLKGPLHQMLNKVGHALHDKDAVFDRFSRRPAFAALASGLGLVQPKLLQSMYIFKPPHIGGEVLCHQDSPYLWTVPQSCIGLWVALEDARIANGCLWGIPGGHREPMPRTRFHRLADGLHTETQIFDEERFNDAAAVPLEVAAGTVIVLHGQFPHLSGANTSDRSREAYSLHLIDGTAEYPDDNWLTWPADDPIRGF